MPPKEKPRIATDNQKIPKALLSVFFDFILHKIFKRQGGGKMQKNERTEKKHDLSLENRKILKATGVVDVESFDETKIFAMLESKAFSIEGKNLKIANFSAETGDLKVEGEIDSVTYSDALSRKAGIFARIFR